MLDHLYRCHSIWLCFGSREASVIESPLVVALLWLVCHLWSWEFREWLVWKVRSRRLLWEASLGCVGFPEIIFTREAFCFQQVFTVQIEDLYEPFALWSSVMA